MKQVKKRASQTGNSYGLVTLIVLLFLVTGLTLSVAQVHNNQPVKSSAFIPISTPTPLPMCTVASNLIDINIQEQAMFDQINLYRTSNRLPPFSWSPALIKSAAWMSNDMLLHRNLSHTDSLGRDPAARMGSCGFPFPADVAENIDSGSSDATAVLSAWEHSRAQSANMLNAKFSLIGIALSVDSVNGAYWTVDFASAQLPTPTTKNELTPLPTLSLIQKLTPSPTIPGNPTSPFSHTPTPTYRFPPTATPLPTKPFTPTHTPPPTAIPTPTMPPGFVKNPFDTQIFVSVKIPGIGTDGNRRPKHLTRHIQVDIFDLTNQPVLSGYGFVIFDGDLFRGIIHLGKIPDGTYYLKIIGENTLEVLDVPQFQPLTSSKLNILPQVTLTQGDINGDNILDLDDYHLALACFQQRRCQSADLIDFNDDGKSDVIDYNLLLRSFQHLSGD